MTKEIVSHQNNFVPQIAEYVQANEALADAVTRRDYFEHLDGSDFIDMVQEVASLIRTGDSNQRQYFDGEKVGLMSHEVPDQREKETLLRDTWDTAKSFLLDREIDDRDALEYAALTVAGGVLYAHPYSDGNGRTSRFLSYIMAEGGQNKADLEKLNESLTNEWQVAPPREIVFPIQEDYKSEQPNHIEWEFQFAGEETDAMGGEIAGSIFNDRILRQFIETADDETKSLIESCATRGDDGTMKSVDGDKLVEVLVNDPEHGLGNAQKLRELKRYFRADYVHRYLAAMRSEEFGARRVISNGDISTEGEMAEVVRKIKTGLAKVVGERAVAGQMLPRDEAVAMHRGYSNIHNRHNQ